MLYNTSEDKNANVASNLILNGEIIIYSTDTLYGFGVDATDCDVISRLNKIKQRIGPYSIIVDSMKMLKKYAIINNRIENKLKQIF